MRIQVSLSAFGEEASRLAAAWVAAGGEPDLADPRGGFVRLQGWEEPGDRVLQVADALRAEYGSPIQRTRVASWGPRDHDEADLLGLTVGDGKRVLDPKSYQASPCATCGMPRRSTPVATGLALARKAAHELDLVADGGFFLVSPRLGAALQPLGVAALHPVGDGADYAWLAPTEQLGLREDGTTWGVPCPTCGTSRGTAPQNPLQGCATFARGVWTGAPVVGEAMPVATLYVDQRVRTLLLDGDWRFPAGLVAFQPVRWAP